MDISTLPQRQGPKPRTTPSNPHEQLEQNASADLQEKLWNWMRALPRTTTRPSGIGPAGTRAVWSDSDAPEGRRVFMIGREFAHLHPRYDGSLHMVLAPDEADAVIASGWAERHPLAGRFAPSSAVMVFGPRDEAELQIVKLIIDRSYAWAIGED